MKSITDILAENPAASDAEILAAIDDSRAYRRVPVATVKLWLLAEDLIGPLYVVRDTTADLLVKGGLSEFLAGITLFESLDATDDQILTKALTLAAGLQAANVITGEQYAAFVDLLKEPMPVTQADVDQYRRAQLVASHVAAAGNAIADANAFIGAAQDWVSTGTGEMPTWGDEE
jgi:hypothetical protein